MKVLNLNRRTCIPMRSLSSIGPLLKKFILTEYIYIYISFVWNNFFKYLIQKIVSDFESNSNISLFKNKF